MHLCLVSIFVPIIAQPSCITAEPSYNLQPAIAPLRKDGYNFMLGTYTVHTIVVNFPHILVIVLFPYVATSMNRLIYAPLHAKQWLINNSHTMY